jgi:hypothetical protein
MTSALAPPPDGLRLWDDLPRGAAIAASAPAEAAPAGVPDGATLDDLVAGAWEALAVGAPAACPSCSEPLRPRWSAAAAVVGGRCDSCGVRVE